MRQGDGDVDYMSSAPCAGLLVTSRAQFVLHALLLSFDTFKFPSLCWRALIFIRPVYRIFFSFCSLLCSVNRLSGRENWIKS
jgi:hypothetical protein